MAFALHDRLWAVNRLKESHMDTATSEAIVEVVYLIQNETLATKADVNILKGDINILKGDRNILKSDRNILKAELLIWVIGLLFAQGTLIIGILKLPIWKG